MKKRFMDGQIVTILRLAEIRKLAVAETDRINTTYS